MLSELSVRLEICDGALALGGRSNGSDGQDLAANFALGALGLLAAQFFPIQPAIFSKRSQM